MCLFTFIPFDWSFPFFLFFVFSFLLLLSKGQAASGGELQWRFANSSVTSFTKCKWSANWTFWGLVFSKRTPPKKDRKRLEKIYCQDSFRISKGTAGASRRHRILLFLSSKCVCVSLSLSLSVLSVFHDSTSMHTHTHHARSFSLSLSLSLGYFRILLSELCASLPHWVDVRRFRYVGGAQV